MAATSYDYDYDYYYDFDDDDSHCGVSLSPPSFSSVKERERVYVAVGKDVEESRSTLSWALLNFTAPFSLLYVHNPRNELLLSRNPFRLEAEMYEVDEILEEYSRICKQEENVTAEKVWTKMEDIGKGIVKLVEELAITRLVMGAAADKHYTEGMDELKSSKASFVNRSAHPSCHIWFICKGHLIQSRKGNLNTVDDSYPVYPSLLASITAEAGQSYTKSPTPSVHSETYSGEIHDPALVRHKSDKQSQQRSESNPSSSYEMDFQDQSPFDQVNSKSQGGGYNKYKHMYMQLRRSMQDAADAKQEVLDESIRWQKAEKTFETLYNAAVRRSKELEDTLGEELKRRKELEEALAKEKEKLQMTRSRQEEELSTSIDDRITMESEMASLHQLVEELKEKILSTEEVLGVYKMERDELQLLLDNAVKVNEDLLTNHLQPLSSDRQGLCEFSFPEVQEATDNFDPSLKIEEGDYGSIYKGVLHQTQVIIKMLHSGSSQGSSLYHQEVEIAGKLRHPNLVTLIGVCPEACSLIYEYLPNGSLEDRLSCNGNSTPLSWQTRLSICIEICRVLIFLHSLRPIGIVHGNLKAGNVLLDANYVSKLSNFGVHSALSHPENPHETNEEAWLPHSVGRHDLSFESDLYSFGMLLLHILTGRSTSTLAEEMRDARDEGNISSLLDPSAGDWPLLSATQLADLALSCCDVDRYDQPDLRSEVLVLLEQMRLSCEATTEVQSNTEDRSQMPQSFTCPIYHEVMQDPHVAADGFTYEGEAIREWINKGHVTSPMTNALLEHLNLVPNLTLRSVIQEWNQRK